MRRSTPARRRGQAMAELALSMPLLLGVLVLIIEGTLVVSAHQTLMDAVHQATRVASREKLTDRQVQERIAVICSNDPLVDPEALAVRVDYGIDSNGSENIRVLAELPVRPVAFTHIGSFHLSADATYRVSRDDENPS